jgi:hypothetical protein
MQLRPFEKSVRCLQNFERKKLPKNSYFLNDDPYNFFSHNLFIKSVLEIGTLYSLKFCIFKVVYGIVFGLTPDLKIISFGVRRLKNRRVTPNREEILSKYYSQHCFICRPSEAAVSEDAGIEPKTATSSARAVRSSNYLSTRA